MSARALSTNQGRPRYLSRVLILTGGALSTLSAALPWARTLPDSLAAGFPALVVNESALIRSGFDVRIGWLSVGWLVAGCGIAAIALMLWDTGDSTPWIPPAQVALGAVIAAVALIHLVALPGVILGMAGGSLVSLGALFAGRNTQ
jgi:hypothetical protein